MNTMADGIAVGRPGAVPFAIISNLVDEIVTVSESEIARAVLMLLERAKLLVEPGGAAATAAVLARPQDFEPPVAVVISGGNVDSLLLMRIIRFGMAAAGRFLTVRVRVLDKPGSLAQLLEAVRKSNSNVVEIEHNRIDPGLSVDEVDIVVQVETRGPEHRDELLRQLAEAGYEILDR
jgi:threonine dehydratase